MLFEKILYINLDRRNDRNVHMVEMLTENNLIEITKRIAGIDGKHLNLDNIDRNLITSKGIEDAKNSKELYFPLTKGGIGCALSHKACYEYIVKNNINRCLILEDDCILVDNFNNKLNILEKKINNINKYFDILFLGYHSSDVKQDINSDEFFVSGKTYGLFGYIISYNAAKILLDHLFPIEKQIDTEIPYHFDKLKAYSVYPKYMLVESDPSSEFTKFGTDIQIIELEHFKSNQTNQNIEQLNIVLIIISIIIILILIKF